jgi:hypothetical protein
MLCVSAHPVVSRLLCAPGPHRPNTTTSQYCSEGVTRGLTYFQFFQPRDGPFIPGMEPTAAYSRARRRLFDYRTSSMFLEYAEAGELAVGSLLQCIYDRYLFVSVPSRPARFDYREGHENIRGCVCKLAWHAWLLGSSGDTFATHRCPADCLNKDLPDHERAWLSGALAPYGPPGTRYSMSTPTSADETLGVIAHSCAATGIPQNHCTARLMHHRTLQLQSFWKWQMVAGARRCPSQRRTKRLARWP